MVEDSDEESLASSEPPFLDLFMTVVRVTDWSASVRWYIETLGLVPILLDPEHEFAFLAAGQARLGLQGVKGPREPATPSRIRLVFQVRDLDCERQRLIAQRVEVTAARDNRAEGYREIRLHDPDGNSLTLFAWIDAARARRFSPKPTSVKSGEQTTDSNS
jgi:catechol 2,3-dioxygenase-like lactoylglutathione lyase family enzyme